MSVTRAATYRANVWVIHSHWIVAGKLLSSIFSQAARTLDDRYEPMLMILPPELAYSRIDRVDNVTKFGLRAIVVVRNCLRS